MFKKTTAFLLCTGLLACAPDQPFDRQTTYLSPEALPASVPDVTRGTELQAGKQSFDAGQYGQAVRYFQKAADASPNQPEAWLGLAAAADRTGHFEISAPAYAQLLTLTGPIVEYYNNLGFSLMLQGRLDAADKAFQDALRIAPGHPTATNNRAILEQLK